MVSKTEKKKVKHICSEKKSLYFFRKKWLTFLQRKSPLYLWRKFLGRAHGRHRAPSLRALCRRLSWAYPDIHYALGYMGPYKCGLGIQRMSSQPRWKIGNTKPTLQRKVNRRSATISDFDAWFFFPRMGNEGFFNAVVELFVGCLTIIYWGHVEWI